MLYQLSYRTIGCKGRIRTNDLRVMSPTSYQTALPRDMNFDVPFEHLQIIMAEELGFEPRRQLPDLPVFKTGPFNHLGIPPNWWTLKDLNLRPIGYGPTALTN